MKKIIWIIIIIILLGGGYFYWHNSKKQTPEKAPENVTTQTIQTTSVSSKVTGNNATTSSSTKLISLAEIAKHNTKADCWTTIDGKVYDLTSFIPNHPGGDKILVICGIDGSDIFHRQHDHNPTQANILATLQIGILSTE